MRNNLMITAAILLVVLLFATVANAAPGLCITKPPVIGPNNTGPPIDPPAQKGQWFLNLWTGEEEYRPCEFYDNVDGEGGGWASCWAIEGYVVFIDYDANNNITGFWLDVCITNDMPAWTPWWDGYNSHEEWLSTQEQIGEEEEVPMLNVKWTAEFADNSIIWDFPTVGWPYWPAQPPFDWTGSIESNIFAFSWMEEEGGYDQLAWYCWTPKPDDPSPHDGQYMVPTWDFGDIHPGQTVSRIIHFRLRMPVDPMHPLYWLIEEWYWEEIDILLNRTSSLKISDYFDVLSYDSCIPYPHEMGEWPFSSSDCSVFFDIEQPEPPVIDDVFRWPTGQIEIVWLCDPNPGLNYRVESSTNPYDYNEAMMTWTTEAILPGMPPMMSWTDFFPPPIIGIEKYYRIWVQGPCGEIRATDTVGAMTIVCLSGRNMVSTPLEPYPDGGLSGGGPMGKASLDKIVGNQLTGHLFNRIFSDNIEMWSQATSTYLRSWYMTGINQWQDWAGGAPLFGLDADVGFWFNLVLNHGPSGVTFCGRVSPVGNRVIPIAMGRNLPGTCKPVSCMLANSGLVASGFTGHLFNRMFSDNIEFYNNATAGYERFWYKTMGAGTWEPWIPGDPMRDFQPGDAFWLNVINLAGHAGFTWFYPVP